MSDVPPVVGSAAGAGAALQALPPAPAPGLRPARALLLILLASCSFAGLSASVKAFLQVAPEAGLGPPVFARGAFGLAACVAWALAGRRSLLPRNKAALTARCVIGALAMLCYYLAIGPFGAELGTAVMLLKTSPLWVALLSPVLLREPSGPRTWLGLVLGLCGLLCVSGLPQGERTGVLLCLVAGVLSGLAYLSLRGLAATDEAPVVVFAFSAVLALGALPFLGAVPAGWAAWPASAWALLLLAGVLGTAGQLFLTAAYRFGTASAVTLGGLSEVALATLASVLLFGQRPALLALVGGALAMTAGVVASSGPRKKPDAP